MEPGVIAALLLLAASFTCAACLGADVAPDKDAVAEVLAGKRETANAAWWGFAPEDSTEAIQSALDSGARQVVIPNLGKPWIVRPLRLTKNNQEVIFEKGVVITAKKGEFKGGGDCLFLATNVRNLILRGPGASLEMRKTDYWGDDYQGGQWRHGLSLRGCRDVQVLGLTVRNTGGDGIYLGRGPDEHVPNENIVVRDCVFDNPHRNGMLVITARHLLVENCVFSNARGHSPMAGVSAEPNKPDEPIVDLRFRNCKILDNDSYGVHFYFYRVLKESEPASILMEECQVSGGHIGLHVAGGKSGSAGGKIVFRNCTVENIIKSGITCREIPADSNLEFVFDNVRLNDCSTRKPLPPEVEAIYKQYQSKRAPWHCRCHYPQPCLDTVPNAVSLSENWKGWYPYGPIVLWAKSAGYPLQGGIQFNNCVVTEPKDIPVFVAAGTGGTGEKAPAELKGWTKISGDIKAEAPNGAKAQLIAPLVDVTLRLNGKPVADGK